MKAIYAREPSKAERQALGNGLKSPIDATVRRSQIILLSADERKTAREISACIGQSDQQVRKVLHAFNGHGTSCLQLQSRARHDDQRAYDDAAREHLRQLLRQSPREHGYESSLWTLQMLAEISYQKGWTEHQVHPDTVSQTVRAIGVNWRRAKHWINSPDEHYSSKKSVATG